MKIASLALVVVVMSLGLAFDIKDQDKAAILLMLAFWLGGISLALWVRGE